MVRSFHWSAARRATVVAVAASCLAALITVGCQVRDEPVTSPDGTTFWPRAPRAITRPTRVATEVAYMEDYDAATQRARAEGRPLLLVFRASWCRWSGALARGPLADPRIVALTRRCVCTQVDADRDAATCRSFGVTAFPTVIVLDALGRECFRGTGASAAGDLAAALDAAPPGGGAEERLAGEATGWYPSMRLWRQMRHADWEGVAERVEIGRAHV